MQHNLNNPSRNKPSNSKKKHMSKKKINNNYVSLKTLKLQLYSKKRLLQKVTNDDKNANNEEMKTQ